MVAERVFCKDPEAMSSDGEGFMEAYSSTAPSSGYTEETLNLSMTAKFRYEELVDDWITFTMIEASKRGPRLSAYMCKAVLQN